MTDTLQISLVFGVLISMVVLLLWDKFKTSVVFLLSAVVLVALGIIEVERFVAGFANVSILTIFLLIVITGGINRHFNVAGLFFHAFGEVKSLRGFLLRMGLGVTSLSALMNNTPVVAVMMPHVYQWGRERNIASSKLLIPLSYAAIFGGVITLIGTSTNLMLNGLIIQNGLEPLSFFDFLLPGIWVALCSLLTIILLAPRLLRSAPDILSSAEKEKREYIVEARLSKDSPLMGKTVEGARLRNLENTYLTEIIRGGSKIAPVAPGEFLLEGDVLLFAGDNTAIVNLVKQRDGIELSKTLEFDLINDTEVVEAVVPQNSSLDHQNVKNLGFRERYDAAIIGIHRRGERLSGKIGEMNLRTGDLLLLVAGNEFRERNQRLQDLVVIHTQPQEKNISQKEKITFWSLTLLLIGGAVGSVLSLFEALAGVALVQLLMGMLSLENIKQSVSLDLLFILVSALAIGEALIASGAAQWLSETLFLNAATWNPLGILVGIFSTTFILTSLITNVAAVSIVFPVIYGLSAAVAIPHQAMFLTAAFGASCCFLTPYAYQTNLMVMELGKYKFQDFLRLGTPVSLVFGTSYLLYAYLVYL